MNVQVAVDAVGDEVNVVEFECYGARVQITHTKDEKFSEFVRKSVPLQAKQCDGSLPFDAIFSFKRNGQSDEWSAVFDGKPIQSGTMIETAEWLITRLTAVLAFNIAPKIAIRAVAVARDGQATIIMGEEFSGKTALAEEYLDRGYSLLSDQLAIVDTDANIYPFSRPFEVESTADSGINWQLESDSDTPIKVGTILELEYKVEGESRFVRPSVGTAAITVLKYTSPTIDRPEVALRTVKALTLNAKCVMGTRREAQEAVDFILKQ